MPFCTFTHPSPSCELYVRCLPCTFTWAQEVDQGFRKRGSDKKMAKWQNDIYSFHLTMWFQDLPSLLMNLKYRCLWNLWQWLGNVFSENRGTGLLDPPIDPPLCTVIIWGFTAGWFVSTSCWGHLVTLTVITDITTSRQSAYLHTVTHYAPHGRHVMWATTSL